MYTDDPDSPLNPRGTNFDARSWAKATADMVNRHGSGFRKSGIAFQNMNVFGYSTETDYQKDVGNVWLELSSIARAFASSNRSQRRIDILRNVNGLVKPGEMLVVLGPLEPAARPS